MHFASDNTGPIHPQVMEALTEANNGYLLPYGNDEVTQAAIAAVRDVFEVPDAQVFFVPTGTSGNALALSTLCMPYQSVLCSALAHIHEDECGAPEFYGVAKLSLIGDSDLMDPDALEREIVFLNEGGVHSAQPGAISITNVTERGRLYTLDHITRIAEVAHRHNLPLHLDGARFANACAALDCSAAEMSWKAGVDVVTFGGTKSGCMGVEAVVFFNPDHARGFAARRKRAGLLFSKSRFLSAQMLGFCRDGLWRHLGAEANARGQYLADILRQHPRIEWPYAPEANMLFPALPRSEIKRLMDSGVKMNHWGSIDGDGNEMLLSRFVCDWSLPYEQIDAFAEILRGMG